MIKKNDRLHSMLSPRSVAVVGASDNADKVGGRPLRYLMTQGFAGRIYAVNPRAATVQGLQAYASLDELPEVPEVAVLCVGAEQVEAQLSLCAKLGVAYAILFASGFAEVGVEGRQRQQNMVDICQAGNVRLVGPNCIGVADFSTGAVLSFASIYNDFPPQDGPIAIVSQSGAIGVCAYALLRGAGWGVSCVVTTGNEADVDTADFVAALVAKDGVRIILLYVEDVKNPARMAAALAEARDKGIAVVALNAGRSSDGIRSAGWHTGSCGAATPEVAELLKAQGCRTVQQLNELVASVPLYLGTAWSVPSDKVFSAGLAVISNSGAACVLVCDEAQRRQITLAQLSTTSRAELDALLPPFSLNRNPVDLTAMLLTDSSLLGRALRCVLDDPSVDAAVLGLLAIGGPSYDTDRFSRDALVAARETAKPLVVFSPHQNVQKIFSEHGHAVYASEAEALGALNGFFAHRAAFNAERVPGVPISNLEDHHD